MRLNCSDLNVFVSFMFDDGRSSIYDVVFPLFESNNIVGSIAFVGSYIDKKGYLMSEQLSELLERGWSMGDHTFTHPNMYNISIERLYYEIKRNQVLAERKFGYRLYYFIFPKSKARAEQISFILKNYAYAFTGTSKIVSNLPPFRGLLTRTEISLYEIARFFMQGRYFFRELIRKISSMKSSNATQWFILYTHNVSMIPSLFDMPKKQFAQLIETLEELEIPILSVDSILSSESNITTKI
ncbi:MAG: polysaccharide deacetylase family protein [Nitrososphaerota archaeon]